MTLSVYERDYEKYDRVYLTADVRHKDTEDRRLYVAVDRVLAIIDKHIETVERCDGTETYVAGQSGMATAIWIDVFALKGGEQG